MLEFLNKLERNKSIKEDDIEDIAEKLIDYGHLAIPIIVKNFTLQKDPLILSRYEYLIMNIYDMDFLKYLVKVNLDENLYLRKSLINLLNFYGYDLTESDIYYSISNYFIETKSFIKAVLENSENSYQSIIELIKMVYFLTDSEKESLIQSILDNYEEKTFIILYLFLWTGSHTLINETLKLLGRMKTGKSLFLLKISKEFLPEIFSEEIERSIKKLNFSGIYNEEKLKFLERNFRIRTKISNLNRDKEFFIFFEISDLNKANKFLFSISDFYFLSVNSYLYDSNDSKLENLFGLKDADSKYLYNILQDLIRNHYDMGVPFPWQFTCLVFFLNYKDLVPKKYECQIEKREEFFLNEFLHAEIKNLLSMNDWLLNDIRFVEIVEKWYFNTEPYEDLWRDHLFIRKVIREIIIPEMEFWKRRLCQLGDYLYLVEGKQKLSMYLHKTVERLKPDIEFIEKEDLIKEIIMYNKEKVLKEKRR
ncbi:MAG: hypothetical protein N2202_06430 [Proteobacteria bacterium]|nr:hypothetical protein [Pseudomonadota bacterium]